MKPSESSWTQKLVALSLFGIFVCLAAMVWEQQRSRHFSRESESVQAPAPPPGPPRPTPRVARPAPKPILVTTPSPTHPPSPPAPEPSKPVPAESAPSHGGLPGDPLQTVSIVGVHRLDATPVELPPSDSGEARGGVMGRVILLGTPPPEVTIRMTGGCLTEPGEEMKTRHYRVSPTRGLADVLVYVSEGLPETTYLTPVEPVELHAVGCLYEPYIFGIQTGQSLRISNQDRTLHNLHITPTENPERNLGLHTGSPSILSGFDKPELFVRMKCDVNPWMFAYVSVFDHPYFAVTDENGNYSLPYALPPGEYTLRAQHRKAGTQIKKITVVDGGAVLVHFELRLPKPATGQAARLTSQVR